MWMTVERDHPLVASSHQFLSAEQALHRGRLTHAIVDAGTAMEMMVAAAVRLIGPERGYSQAKLEGALEAPFGSLLKDHFARLLEYGEDPASAGDPLGEWWRKGYLVRNAVVHEGRKATANEAEEALGSALQLQRDFIDRVKVAGLGEKLPGVPQRVKETAEAARGRCWRSGLLVLGMWCSSLQPIRYRSNLLQQAVEHVLGLGVDAVFG